MVDFQQDADSVVAKLRRDDGREESVDTEWLLGCDGAHSTTRHTLGFNFEGSAYNESFATADVHVSWSNPEDEMFAYLHEEGTVVFFPLGKHRYRIIANGPLHTTGDALALEEMQKMVDTRGPAGVVLSDPVWLTWFTILVDDDHSLHCLYGAAHQCLYLIRPDGYVGFRGQPIDFAPLHENLRKVFSGDAVLQA